MKPRILLPGLAGLMAVSCNTATTEEKKPNIILIMADDMGYGDVGFMGNAIVQTPHLDAMASQGVQFNRFYAASPVSSPTRASCLTGRHPYRSGIPWAGRHALPYDETTIASVLKASGYATAHFGKWHIGGLSRNIDQSHFPDGPTPYSPPWQHGFDVAFSTESMMPLYNPYYHVGGDYGSSDYRHVQTVPVEYGQRTGGHPWKNLYWTGPGQFVDEELKGNNPELIMDRALRFIKEQVDEDRQFFAVIWFHTPHTPVVAGNEYRDRYPGLPMEAQHWFGCISAMDDQIGRLRMSLNEWLVGGKTIVWFKSDNGPSYIHGHNSAGTLRGGKAELFEGGIRVPSVLVWPERFQQTAVIDYPVSTSDLFPTLLAMAGIEYKSTMRLDGENVLPVISEGKKRENPIAFISPLPDHLQNLKTRESEQLALIGEQFKLLSMDDGFTFQLYDLVNDPGESSDISSEYPEVATAMQNYLHSWLKEVRKDASRLKHATTSDNKKP